MRQWINIRRNQISLLLTGVFIITINNFIIPAYESLVYYQEKTATLDRQYQKLYNYSLHIRHHEKRLVSGQEQLAKLEQDFNELRDAAYLQQYFGTVQRACHLKVVTQEIKKGDLSRDLESVQIEQTLEGGYRDQMRYLKTILKDDHNLLLEQYQLENRAPFSNNPTLTARIFLTLFLPVK